VPLLAEYVIDGRPLGLTLVRADVIVLLQRHPLFLSS